MPSRRAVTTTMTTTKWPLNRSSRAVWKMLLSALAFVLRIIWVVLGCGLMVIVLFTEERISNSIYGFPEAIESSLQQIAVS